MTISFNSEFPISKTSSGGPLKGDTINIKPDITFPKYQPPEKKLTPKQKEYVDAQRTMADIEAKYGRPRNSDVYYTKPFDTSQLSPGDKKEYMKAKGLVDKVTNAQSKMADIEAKYGRPRNSGVYYTKPFDTSQLSPDEKREYMSAQKIVDTYMPKEGAELQNFEIKV